MSCLRESTYDLTRAARIDEHKRLSGMAAVEILQVARRRQRVVVTTHGEQFPGTSGMAVPVFSFIQSLAGAMILSGPTSRFDDETVRRMETLLLEAGASLTRELGGNPLLFDIRRREMGLNADRLSTARKRSSKAGI